MWEMLREDQLEGCQKNCCALTSVMDLMVKCEWLKKLKLREGEYINLVNVLKGEKYAKYALAMDEINAWNQKNNGVLMPIG